MESKTLSILQTMNKFLQNSSLDHEPLVQGLSTEFSSLLGINVLVCCKNSTRIAAAGSHLGLQPVEQLDKLKLSNLSAINGNKINVSLRSLHILPDKNMDKPTVVLPLHSTGLPVGTILFFKDETFSEPEQICLEWFASAISLLLSFRFTNESNTASRQRKTVRTALSALSYSELEAVTCIFAELTSSEGLVIASKIADRVGITRSVIVNALRKLESAIVIETRSLGMKGTYIHVTNSYLFEELNRLNG